MLYKNIIKILKSFENRANKLDINGNFNKADKIDKEFEKFLKDLENGNLIFDYTDSISIRPPNTPYNNPGRSPKMVFDI